jgi:hypothetical protein
MSEAKTDVLNLYQKIAKITGEIGSIKKGGTNREQGYAFIEYAAVAGELRHLFAKYGVVVVPRMAQASKQHREVITTARGGRGEHVLVDFTYTVVNADNPDDNFTVQWTGEATDYGDKATNKAATSALKYYLMRQFNVSEKGDDPDADSPVIEKDAQVASVRSAPTKLSPSQKQIAMMTDLAKQSGYGDDWIANVVAKADSQAYMLKVIDQLKEKQNESKKAEEATEDEVLPVDRDSEDAVKQRLSSFGFASNKYISSFIMAHTKKPLIGNCGPEELKTLNEVLDRVESGEEKLPAGWLEHSSSDIAPPEETA